MYRQRQPEPRKNPSERSRQSKRLVFRRSMVLMGVFGLGLYIPLLIQLWNIAIVHHDEYQTKAIEQQLMDVTVSANRKSISLTRDENCEGLLFQPELVQQVAQGFCFLKPYYEYLMDLAGDAPPERI